MDLGIKNKVALVTGASAGLGLAAAIALADEGAKVAINSRSEDNLKKAAEQIQEITGYIPSIFPGDLAIDGKAEEIVDKVSAEMGTVEILVANAGGPPAGPFMNHSKEVWQKSADVTLFASMNLTRAVIPAMVKKKWGRVVFITSIAVKQPVDGLIISNTLRAGLTGFAKTISNEYAQFGLTINTVCPGFTKTERLHELAKVKSEALGNTPEDIYDSWVSITPAGRLGEPEELAGLIAFLSSKKAAFITGSSIAVEGGSYKGLL
ncbi:MAG: SDR family oxidoreductase [candidate division Zixibacteria bacterium]|nr:SDR family oxidoreductase [candidate division Zixibacteria bacterium]